MSTEDIKKSREFVSLVIRSWRGNLFLAGFNYSDKKLASFVGVNPVAFSRLSNGTSTASLPTFRSIEVAILDTLGSDYYHEIMNACRAAVYENK